MHGYLHANSFIANCALVSIGKGVLAGSTMVNASALIFLCSGISFEIIEAGSSEPTITFKPGTIYDIKVSCCRLRSGATLRAGC
jgi:hypothetical protein